VKDELFSRGQHKKALHRLVKTDEGLNGACFFATCEMILRHYTGSAGAAGKAHIKSLFEKHLDIVYDDLSVHAADLHHTVIPGDFHPFDRHRMFRFVYTGFNLNQSQPGPPQP
jgi:hypothetical protein